MTGIWDRANDGTLSDAPGMAATKRQDIISDAY